RSSFITAAFYLIDYQAGGFSFARAGHCHTLYYHSIQEEVSYFRTEGLGLGIIRNAGYEKHVKTQFWDYNPGDVMVIYTDGIVEARDGEGNEYGEERLRQMLETEVIVNQVVLAVDEVVANFIIHANGEDASQFLDLQLALIEQRLDVEIEDYGATIFAPSTTAPNPDLREYIRQGRKGGMGMALVSRIMDHVEFFERDAHTVCHLSKVLALCPVRWKLSFDTSGLIPLVFSMQLRLPLAGAAAATLLQLAACQTSKPTAATTTPLAGPAAPAAS
nr:hypothetical protein [Tanacetum cinerariifolium]